MDEIKVGDIVTFKDPDYRVGIDERHGDLFEVQQVPKNHYVVKSLATNSTGWVLGPTSAVLYRRKGINSKEDMEALYDT
jgi:signal peptidase I